MKFRVLKVPLTDTKANKALVVGDIIDRTAKEIEEFEKKHGQGYLEKVENKSKE